VQVIWEIILVHLLENVLHHCLVGVVLGTCNLAKNLPFKAVRLALRAATVQDVTN